jgi:hypothetical protein
VMMNNPFMVRMSEHLAERVRARASSGQDQVSFAVQLVLGRPPEEIETKIYSKYAERHGLVNLCRLLLNTNEFLFVD